MADSPFTKEVLKRLNQTRKKTRGIPDPQADVPALFDTVSGLKEAVETLLRVRNDAGESALLVRELDDIFSMVQSLIESAISKLEIPESTTTPVVTPGVTDHAKLQNVRKDQHHAEKHNLFSLDHPDVNPEVRLPGSAIIWSGSQYNHVVVPTVDVTQAVIDPGQTAGIFSFFLSGSSKSAKVLIRATDSFADLTRASEVRVTATEGDTAVTTSHYGITGDVILYKVTGVIGGGECGIEITNNSPNSIVVHALPVLTAT